MPLNKETKPNQMCVCSFNLGSTIFNHILTELLGIVRIIPKKILNCIFE